MIIPSIDLEGGRAVQLRRGRERLLDGGDPFERLEEFAVAGEVAVVDLDAALGRGSNAPLIREMVRRASCRVGGGIRDVETARAWLDAGAAKVMIGTAASRELCAALPRDRVIVAVDAERGEIVVDGWRRRTGVGPVERIRELAPWAGGFLLTQVEHEGGLAGFDLALVERAVAAAGDARVVAAGGVRDGDEIAALDRLGADAQVGMALYSGRLPLGRAVAAPLTRPVDGLWPTVVADEAGVALGLVWSSRESIEEAVLTRRGVYWSRSRQRLWKKGETSGARQHLLRVDLDCDRDALRFTVRQEPPGFCHRATRACWPERFAHGTLERIVARRREEAPAGSRTARLLADAELLGAKLREEAGELASAASPEEAVHEAADLLYFLTVAAVGRGAPIADVYSELARRHRQGRRPLAAKPDRRIP